MSVAGDRSAEIVFPEASWSQRAPGELGLDASKLDELAKNLGGRGCVIRYGHVVKSWGDQAEVGDWFSSAKPVLSTMLFFALQEGRVKSVDQPLVDFGWELSPKDRTMTFRHLGAMSSGYARPEPPGTAWAYNDFAIQLYQKTLFDRVFPGDAKENVEHPTRLGALKFEDGLKFNGKRRLYASVRDFSRIVWFWCNRGNWNGQQVLASKYFDEYMLPQAPKDLPLTRPAETNDYLGIKSYGGGSDHFSKAGAGVYGFNWWFNTTGRGHLQATTWPDAPADTVMSLGARGNNSAIIPSLGLAIVCANGDWGDLEAGNRDSKLNQSLKLLASAVTDGPAESAEIPTATQWQPTMLSFEGPELEEQGSPNPFTDFRLDVTFQLGARKVVVPGYFAADGNAAETSADKGRVWQVQWLPDTPGLWKWSVRFRTGTGIAQAEQADAGTPTAFDGQTGSIRVNAYDPAAPGFYSQGLLRYTGERYLRFAETGEAFLKGGTDSPENLLAFADFDQTEPTHRYEPHAADYKDGDVTWQGGKGKNLIGALNYLAAKEMNSVYFLTMNVKGDGKDVWPWTSRDERMRFDCSKLAQWELVFRHMDRIGLVLHIVHQETENDQLLDGGELGPERRLYYRELIARFAHHPAIVWNLGEENTNTLEQQQAFAKFFGENDPYRHPRVIHTFPSQVEKVYAPLLGDLNLEGASFQFGKAVRSHPEAVDWLTRSEAAGRPWFVCMDEIGPASICLPPDIQDPEHSHEVRHALWGNLIAGGSGAEWIVAYDTWPRVPGKHLDIACENLRPWENMWTLTAIANRFFREHVPFATMRTADHLVEKDHAWCLAQPGEVYVVYLFGGQPTTLELPEGEFTASWFNVWKGGDLIPGAALKGPGPQPVGEPPSDKDKDWVLLVRRTR
ncbi:MAG: DUF5060 domain-containing protein [Planctomycetaceae bacterium]